MQIWSAKWYVVKDQCYLFLLRWREFHFVKLRPLWRSKKSKIFLLTLPSMQTFFLTRIPWFGAVFPELLPIFFTYAKFTIVVDCTLNNIDNYCYKNTQLSMTSLLTHTVTHFTRHSFRPKYNNHPIKKFLSLAVSWVKVVKNCKILTFKVNFLCQKLSESF